MPTVQVETEQQEEQAQEQHEKQSAQDSDVTEQKEVSESQDHQEDHDEVIVTIGEQKDEEEEQQESAPQWVKELRKSHREAQRELRELREKLHSQSKEEQTVKLGEKPTLEGCGYDDERFESELASWFDRKRQVEENNRKAQDEQQKAAQAWQAKLDSYAKARSELKVSDYEDAEAVVQENLSQTQQGIIVQGAKNPALMVYALGKNPAKLKEIAAISDPVQFAVAVGELSKEINMKPKTKPPAPEKVPSGSGSLAGSTDRTLDMLRAEAEKTGDYTKVVQYRNNLRNKK